MANDKKRQGKRIQPEEIHHFVEGVFIRLQIPAEDASIVADVLVEAELRGFGCHGLGRLLHYVQRLRCGLIEKSPEISIQWMTDTTGNCDGGNGFGMVVGHRSMRACIERARETGSAFLTVKNSNHFSIAGYYSSLALEYNMIGIAMSNASPRVVPTGGTTGKFGTNPISVAIPRKDGAPFILDMSTSVVSSGKIDDKLHKEEDVPEGWVYPSIKPFLNSEGVAPMSVLQLPLGGIKETSGYKGYGLALFVDILCGVLSGSRFGSLLASAKSPEEEANIGHFFGAIQLTGFRDIEGFFQDFETLIDDVKSSPLEPGTSKIYIAGEPEAEARDLYGKKGIPILPAVMKQIRQIGTELKVDIPF